MGLTRSDILGIQDIQVKEIDAPPVAGWKGKTLFIRQLSRAQQDEYFRRQFGPVRMRQEARQRGSQEIAGINLYGHDAYLFAMGVCDENGKTQFSEDDIPVLAKKNGEAIGYVAKEILEFSGMGKDVEELQEIKNSREIPSESSSTG